jgi:hypothetical protein
LSGLLNPESSCLKNAGALQNCYFKYSKNGTILSIRNATAENRMKTPEKETGRRSRENDRKGKQA